MISRIIRSLMLLWKTCLEFKLETANKSLFLFFLNFHILDQFNLYTWKLSIGNIESLQIFTEWILIMTLFSVSRFVWETVMAIVHLSKCISLTVLQQNLLLNSLYNY